MTSTTTPQASRLMPVPSGANMSQGVAPHTFQAPTAGSNQPMRGTIGQPMVAPMSVPIGVQNYRVPINQPIISAVPVEGVHPAFINPAAIGQRMRPGPVSPIAASMATVSMATPGGMMGSMATNIATSVGRPPTILGGNPPIPSAPIPQMSRPTMIRNPSPQVLNVPKVPTPPVVRSSIVHQSVGTQGMTAPTSFHSQISPRCPSAAQQQPPPAHSPVNIESISFAVSGQAVDMTKRTTVSPRLSALGTPGEQGIDLSKHSTRDTDSVKSSDSDILKPHEPHDEKLVVKTEADHSIATCSDTKPDTLTPVPTTNNRKTPDSDFEIKLEAKFDVTMTTTSYTGEVSMATSEFVATVDESALPPLNVTAPENSENKEQLSEIDRRLREKLKREKQKERKRQEKQEKEESEKKAAELTENISAKSSLFNKLPEEGFEQKTEGPSGDGLVVKTSVRYTEGIKEIIFFLYMYFLCCSACRENLNAK